MAVDIKKIWKAKKEFHKALARLPFKKKIEILKKLQKLVRDKNEKSI